MSATTTRTYTLTETQLFNLIDTAAHPPATVTARVDAVSSSSRARTFRRAVRDEVLVANASTTSPNPLGSLAGTGNGTTGVSGGNASHQLVSGAGGQAFREVAVAVAVAEAETPVLRASPINTFRYKRSGCY